MKQTGSVFLVTLILAGGPAAQALEFAVQRSFATDFITASPLRSLSVSPREDLFLLAFSDGSIFEVNRDLDAVTQILPPPEPPQESTWIGYDGVTLIPSLNLFVAFGLSSNSYEFFTRGGIRAGIVAPYTLAAFTGAFYEEKEPVGEIHAVCAGFIDHRRLPRMGVVDGAIQLPFAFTRLGLELGRRYKRNGLSGMAYISTAEVYLLSLVDGQIFAFTKTEKLAFAPQIWQSRILAQTDLKPLGVRSIDDLAWDPILERLYVADTDQSMVFELSFAPSGAPFHRGDPDGSGALDLADPVFLLEHLFLGGAPPNCLESADANNDGAVDVSDAVFLLSFLFVGGEEPPPPGPPGRPCGREPEKWDSQFGLGCASYPRC